VITQQRERGDNLTPIFLSLSWPVSAMSVYEAGFCSNPAKRERGENGLKVFYGV
jgi:hypothetical protein